MITSALTNYDLEALAFPHYLGAYLRDKIKGIKVNTRYPFEYAIINLDDSEQDGKPIGTHWCLFAFLHKLGTVVYVDPYGSPPPEEVIRYCRRVLPQYKRVYNNAQIQSMTSVTCGYWCLYFADHLRKFDRLNQAVSFFSKFLDKTEEDNERMLEKYFEHVECII